MIILTITLFLFISAVVFYESSNSKNKIVFFICGCLLFILAIFRDGNLVLDYANYVNLYKDRVQNIEVSFVFISWLVKNFFYDNVWWLFFMYAFLGIWLKLKAIKQLSEFWFLPLLIYVSHFYMLHELVQIRIGVAVGFVLLCIKPLYDRNLKLFLLYASLAVFFHYSTLIILPLWFLKRDKINLWVYASILPIGYLFYFLKISIVQSVVPLIPIQYIQYKFETYQILTENKIDKFNKINVFNIVFIIKLLIYYILLFKYQLVYIHNKYAILIIKIHALALVCFLFFFDIPVFGGRMYDLLDIVELILIPFLIYIYKPAQLVKVLIFIFAFIVMLMNIFYINLIKF